MDRKEETKVVKKALAVAGINAMVEHGNGTAWGWLRINVGSAEQFGEHVLDRYHSHANCTPCKRIYAVADRALAIARETTGRDGDYDGKISVLTQKHWDAKRHESVEILQPEGL